MFDEEEVYSPCASAEDLFTAMDTALSTTSRRKKTQNKRRFSDEQIKSLETMFESESRLEPRKKLQLAKELGLQPRQVAIWFQNKRARWKSKQLERDYSVLRANYNNLASRFETLKKEKQALAIRLQKLNELIEKPREEGECCGEQETGVNSSEGESEAKGVISSFERSRNGLGVASDEDSSIKVEYFGLEEEPDNNLISMVEAADGSLTSQEDWRSLESDGLFDQSNSGSDQWWDFWA
uniref:Homeobox-leucine zipper protein n=1 Tax=Jatropha curcas TaxID=180498 RepID=A0A0A7CB71_JATCU|nr:homeobox 12 [Jatropha curcas]